MTLVDGTVVRAKDVTGASTKGRKVLEPMDNFISYYFRRSSIVYNNYSSLYELNPLNQLGFHNVSMIQLLCYFSTFLLFLDVSIISQRF